MKTYSAEELEKLRDRKQTKLEEIGVTDTSIGLDKGGQVCLRLWCDSVNESLLRAVREDDELGPAPVVFEEGTDFVPYSG